VPQSVLASQPVQIFRAGNYGAKGTYTLADLDQIVSSYNPANHEAPATTGHSPASNEPAGAWVKTLQRDGDVLVARFGDVDPEFESSVQTKFKNRSAGIRRDPATGKLSLHHVAFLGAKVPHVKGLKPIVFSDDEMAQVATINFEESEMPDLNAEQKKGLFAEFMETLGLSRKPEAAATATFSEEQLNAAAEKLLKPKMDALDAQIAKFSESEKEASTAASSTRAKAAVDALKAKGRWVPAFEKLGLVQVFEQLAKSDEVITFGEGDTKVESPALDALEKVMEAVPKMVPAGTTFDGKRAESAPAQVNPNGRAEVDSNSLALDAATKQRMSEKNLDYGAALSQVAAEKPELTRPGNASGGAV
jgi:hypothetical protein